MRVVVVALRPITTDTTRFGVAAYLLGAARAVLIREPTFAQRNPIDGSVPHIATHATALRAHHPSISN